MMRRPRKETVDTVLFVLGCAAMVAIPALLSMKGRTEWVAPPLVVPTPEIEAVSERLTENRPTEEVMCTCTSGPRGSTGIRFGPVTVWAGGTVEIADSALAESADARAFWEAVAEQYPEVCDSSPRWRDLARQCANHLVICTADREELGAELEKQRRVH